MTRVTHAEAEMETTIVRREIVAADIVRLTLQLSSGDEFPEWEPGAHVDLLLQPDLVRQYSLCGDPADRSILQVAVLREPSGRGGSAFVHDTLTEGDRLRIRGPRNNFPLASAGEYIFIAGGIGITPILPMLRQVDRAGIPWRLIYGGRSRESMAFHAELAERHGDRVSIQPQSEVGLLDLAAAIGTPRDAVAVYCCGPEGLLQAVEQQCQQWPPGSLHVERFAAKAAVESEASASFEVELAQSGQTLTVPADRSIADVLRDAGVEVPVSCLEGICGTCETAVFAGTPDHRDSILSDEERAANDTMFICVSRSRTPLLRIDR